MSWNLADIRRLKINRTYTVAQIAAILRVSRGTVLNWKRHGLAPVDDGRPALFRGDTAQAYLRDRRISRQQRCPPGHLYCLPCRVPKSPALGMVDYIPRTPTNGNLRGICPDCDRLIHRATSLATLEGARGDLEVRFPEGN